MNDNTSAQDCTEAESVVADLVIAILAVNFWTLEKVYSLRTQLASRELFNMKFLADHDVSTVTDLLVTAGYQHGGFPVPKMAERLIGTGSILGKGGEAKLNSLLAKGPGRDLDDFLLGLKGVGPVVVTNFKVLRGIEG